MTPICKRACSAVLAAALSLGCMADPTKRSEKPPSAPHSPQKLEVPYVFALYGDSRDGFAVHRMICGRIIAGPASFVVSTGDLVHNADKIGLWENYREITRALRERLPYHPAKGNHDDGGEGHFEKEFGLRRPYYAVRKGPVELFFLDSNALDDGQLAWFEKAAAASGAEHKIAVMHHVSFSLRHGRRKESRRYREKLHARFVRAGVCAVFNGHDHHFQTSVQDGVRYVVTGGGGAPLYDADTDFDRDVFLFAKLHHYILMEVGEGGIRARVYSEEGVELPRLRFSLCERR